MTTKTNRFGTFEGVFTPCLLSILGVIMYLRLGWVVGQVGLGGAMIIIGFANLITLATALSMSSIITNIRIGTGGAYSIITKSLGIEAGGAIGIPLYISQAVSIGFYIAGFTECWLFVFPDHFPLLVSLGAWAVLLIVSYISAKLAFRIQFGIMALIVASIVSIVLGQADQSWQVSVFNQFSTGNFWDAFAIFFPAVTGILAGASMSGELVDPKKNIPIGTLGAIIVSFFIYVALAFWFAAKVPVDVLQTNNTAIIDFSKWPMLVIGGIMGATISSALSMFVGSPRVLLALGKHAILPFSDSFARLNEKGEPVGAILFTALIALITILFGSLNEIANLLTMFFLITYGMINLTVFIEQSIGIISFRPSFRVPKIVPFLGSLGCGIMMFLIDAQFSLIAIFVIICAYFILIKREASVYSPDIRSGMLLFMAEQLAKAADKLPYYPKIWKPNLLVPIRDVNKLLRVLPFIRAVVFPAGRTTIVKIIDQKQAQELYSIEKSETVEGEHKDPKEQLNEAFHLAVEPLKDEGIFVETAVVEAPETLAGTITVMQTVRGMFFPPNTLFYMLEENKKNDYIAAGIIEKASHEGLGVVTLYYHPKIGFSQEQIINLWIRRQSPNINLSILMALQLKRNWEAQVRIIQIVRHESEREEAQIYLTKLKDLMRIPMEVEIVILVGNFNEVIHEAPSADLNIFGMQEKPDIEMIRTVAASVHTSVLFLRDSKHESALA